MSAYKIVSFFDGDDYVHPQRFDILNRTMAEYPEVDLLLHNFEKFTYEETIICQMKTNITILLRPDQIQRRYESRGWHVGELVTDWKKHWRRMYMIWVFPEYPSIANGWSTMNKRSVLDSIPYIPLNGAEDSFHNAQVIIRGMKVMVINADLGFYRQRVNRRKTC